MAEDDLIEHKVIIDNTISISLKIPKVLDAMAFKGMLAKINSIIKTTGFDVSYPGIEKDIKAVKERILEPGQNKLTIYTEEEKVFLRELVKDGAGPRILCESLYERFGKMVNKTTMRYHMENDFNINTKENRRRDKITVNKPETDIVEFIIEQFYVQQKTAVEVSASIKEKFNKDMEPKQIYYIANKHRRQQTSEFKKVMGQNKEAMQNV